MTDNERNAEVAEKIKKLRASLGLNQADFAELLGAAGNGPVSRWESGIQLPNREYSAKMAQMLGVTVGQFLGIETTAFQSTVPSRMVKLVGELQAGTWRESIEYDHDKQNPVPLPAMFGLPDIPLEAYVVRGPSMNRIYPDGAIVYVASTIANGIRPKSGQRVLVSRRNRDGLYEATIKEYVVEADGSKWLWPRSFDPESAAPIKIRDDNTEEVTITGVVVATAFREAMV